MAASDQTRRRLLYGANVALACVVATAIVVLLNAMAQRWYLRTDLTGRYSLSPQTRRVLEQLEGDYRMVTLLGDPENPHQRELIQQVRDVTREFGRASARLTVEHVDPRSVGRLELFYASLLERYEPQLSPLRQSIDAASDALSQLRATLPAQEQIARALLESSAVETPDERAFVERVQQALVRLNSDLPTQIEQVREELAGDLPRFAAAADSLEATLAQLDEQLFAVAQRRFEQIASRPSTPAAAKEQMLELARRMQQARRQIKAPLNQLRSASVPEAYQRLRQQIAQGQAVVLLGPEQVHVITLEPMFSEALSPEQADSNQAPQVRFLNEEQITGALLSMQMAHPPLVVFVNPSMRPMLGRGGYSIVAERLRAANADVREWQVGGGVGPGGQPAPPGPAPEPAEGQPAVWVLLPGEPPNPNNPAASMGPQNTAKAVDHIRQRLARGDGAMLMLMPSMAGFASGPDLELAQTWGIDPHVGELLLRQVVLPNGQAQPVALLTVSDWAKQLPVTAALQGMRASFLEAMPLTLDPEAPEGVERWPLVQVQDPAIWPHGDFTRDPQLNPETAGKPYVLAAAAEKDQARLVVVGSPSWVADQLLLSGRFPAEANPELFVNSVLWLADLDQLIAASARAQEIARIEPIGQGKRQAITWVLLLGMPAVVLLVGVGVWSVRRRD